MVRTLSADLLEQYLDPLNMTLLRLVKTEAERLGLPLFMVGGSVRDLLLGRAIHDFDLTVEGDAARLAEAVLRKYAGRVLFHSRFGTATWTLDEITYKRLNVPKLSLSALPSYLDFVSARSETYTQPGALPVVKRSTIGDDLRRRDFTVNAMALRLDGKYFGELYDPLGGQEDLERHLIRILHDRSFVDDPTRMLRAVRYAVRYGFEIEPATLNLINDEARRVLATLSGERLRREIDLMFEEVGPSTMLQQLAGLGLLSPVHPSLNSASSLLPALEVPSPDFGEFVVPDILSFKQTLGWTLWLMTLSPSEIDLIASRLAFPVPLVKAARSASVLFDELPSITSWKPSQWTFHLDELPKLSVYAVYLRKQEPVLQDYLIKWQFIKPITNGNDLTAYGLEPGPQYAELLRQLRAAWLDGNVKTKEDELVLLGKLSHG